jgi:hypothetical protein
VSRSSANTARASRTALLLWFVPPFFELPAVMLLSTVFDEVAREAIYGSPGTAVVLAAVLIVVVVGTVLAWVGVRGATSTVAAAALFVSAGLTGALLLGFLTRGAYLILAVLLAHSAVSIALIGRAVLRSDATPEGRPA